MHLQKGFFFKIFDVSISYDKNIKARIITKKIHE